MKQTKRWTSGDREWIVEWEDGTEWVISWLQDAGAFFAQRWFLDEDDEHSYLDCPGPDLGLFDSLDTLELRWDGPCRRTFDKRFSATARPTPSPRARWRPGAASLPMRCTG